MDIPVEASAPPAGRVPVADDEKAHAGVVASCLARAGCTVVQAHTGPGALAAARTERPDGAAGRSGRTERPDVVILVLGLPGLDGIEVCRRMRASSECDVLLPTARGDDGDELAGLAVGADDCITKPISVRELVAAPPLFLEAVPRAPPAGGSGARLLPALPRGACLP